MSPSLSCIHISLLYFPHTSYSVFSTAVASSIRNLTLLWSLSRFYVSVTVRGLALNTRLRVGHSRHVLTPLLILYSFSLLFFQALSPPLTPSHSLMGYQKLIRPLHFQQLDLAIYITYCQIVNII